MNSGAEADAFRLIYRSHNLIPAEARKRDLGVLFSTARSHNKAVDVTGALLCSDDVFVQVLEGPEESVRSLFDHISGDPRHDSVSVIESGYVGPRAFSRWAMAEVGDEGEADIPLIAHRDGISPSAGRRTTEEQEALLEIMRDAARGETHAH